MKLQSLLYLGTKEIGSVLFKYLLENHHNKTIDIVGVCSNNRSLGTDFKSVNELALIYGIRVFKNVNELLDTTSVDFILSVQFDKILKQSQIDKAKNLAINVHIAPLPEYRGCNQFSFAIADGVNEFGTTIHKLEKGIDSGDIIFESRFAIPENCFVKELYNLAFNETVELFKNKFINVIHGNYNLIPQNKFSDKRASSIHYREEINKLKIIDNKWDKEEQKKIFRATFFPPFPNPILKKGDSFNEVDLNWYNSL